MSNFEKEQKFFFFHFVLVNSVVSRQLDKKVTREEMMSVPSMLHQHQHHLLLSIKSCLLFSYFSSIAFTCFRSFISSFAAFRSIFSLFSLLTMCPCLLANCNTQKDTHGEEEENTQQKTLTVLSLEQTNYLYTQRRSKSKPNRRGKKKKKKTKKKGKK